MKFLIKENIYINFNFYYIKKIIQVKKCKYRQGRGKVQKKFEKQMNEKKII